MCIRDRFCLTGNYLNYLFINCFRLEVYIYISVVGTKYTILFGLIFKSFTFVMTVEITEGESSVITRGDTNNDNTE